MKGQYTTGEIAKMAGVTTRTIRYYDNKGVLSPVSYTHLDVYKRQHKYLNNA